MPVTQPDSSSIQRMLTRRELLNVAGGLVAGWAGGILPGPSPAMGSLSDPAYQVAVGQSTDYEPQAILDQLAVMFENLGGLDTVIRQGDRVAIKINLTGGVGMQFTGALPVVPASHYMTHPAIVRAFATLARDAGAKDLYIVEAPFDDLSFSSLGYDSIAEDLDATLINLNDPQPYDAFEQVPVGESWYVYSDFMMHRVLREADVLVSIAKMKCHSTCGVTLSMKNLVGLLPVSCYRADPADNWRSALHGDFSPQRVPRVVVDLNRARPVDLAIIDGVETIDGGELPRGNFAPVQSGVMLAGRNALATDAVATAIMGFDPTVNYPDAPFLNGDNHLNLARQRRLGTNLLDNIEVLGAALEEVQQHFRPAVAVPE